MKTRRERHISEFMERRNFQFDPEPLKEFQEFPKFMPAGLAGTREEPPTRLLISNSPSSPAEKFSLDRISPGNLWRRHSTSPNRSSRVVDSMEFLKSVFKEPPEFYPGKVSRWKYGKFSSAVIPK